MSTATGSRVFAVVLAAGSASRFGTTKQLAETGGQTLVARALENARAIAGERTLLVLGHDRDAVARACAPLPGFLAINERYRDGIGTSIGCAARVLNDCADAILIVLADQPAVSAEDLATLVDSWSGRSDEIVAARFENTLGPPALLPRDTFADLLRLDGDSGAKALFADPRFRVREIDCPAAAIDVDRPEDLAGI